MNWSQQGRLHQLLMFNSTSVNLIGVHWSHWSASTWWLAFYDMCLISFGWVSVIYCTLISVRAQLSQLGFWSVVNWCFHCGLHSVKLDSLIQFEWSTWEFELSWNSCIWNDHCIVSSFFHLITQSCYSHCSTILPILCIFVCHSLWDCVFSS